MTDSGPITPYHPSQKGPNLGGVLGFLLCFAKTTKLPAYQEVQEVKHVLPREEVVKQMIGKFILNTRRPRNDFHDGMTRAEFREKAATNYSEAMQGSPVCVLIQTPKDAWLLGLTKTVKLRWPDFFFKTKPVFQKRYNLDNPDLAAREMMADDRGYEIMRETEKWKAILAPYKNGKVDIESGLLYAWKGKTLFGLMEHEISPKARKYYTRIHHLQVPKLLNNLKQFYEEIELDRKKFKRFIGPEIYSRPEDYDNPRGRGRYAEYSYNPNTSLLCRAWNFLIPGLVAHGVEKNFNTIYPIREIPLKEWQKRIPIPAPKNGLRLVYKVEIDKNLIPFYNPNQIE